MKPALVCCNGADLELNGHVDMVDYGIFAHAQNFCTVAAYYPIEELLHNDIL